MNVLKVCEVCIEERKKLCNTLEHLSVDVKDRGGAIRKTEVILPREL